MQIFRRQKSRLFLISLFTIVALCWIKESSAMAEVITGKDNYKLCAFCHGAQGEGNKALEAPAIAGLPAWYVLNQFEKYQNGVRGWHANDLPGKRMRPMARTLMIYNDEALAKKKMENIAQYVEQMKPVVPQNNVSGNLVNGEAKYQVCSACHGADGNGNKVLNAPPLIYLNDWYLLSQLKAFKNGWRGARSDDITGMTMRPNAMTMEDQDMLDVITYIQQLRELDTKTGAE